MNIQKIIKDNKEISIILLVAFLIIILVILSFSKVSIPTSLACQPNDTYNIDTGKLCPGKHAPPPCSSLRDKYNYETGKLCPNK